MKRDFPSAEFGIALICRDVPVELRGLRLDALLGTLFELLDDSAVTIDGSAVERKRAKLIGVGHIDLLRELLSQFVERKAHVPAFGIFQTLFDEAGDPLQFR